MTLGASRSDFLPDDNLKFRAVGAVALTDVFTSNVLSLSRLAAYWRTNEWGVAEKLIVAVHCEAIGIADGQTYDFTLQVDDNAAMTSPTEVDRVSLAAAPGATFELALSRATLLRFDSAATHMRLKMTPNSVAETGTIVFSSVANDGDTVTIDDSVNTPVVYTFGDGTGGTVDKGVSATTSAQNLKTAIEASVTAEDLNVSVAGASTTLTITNLAANTGGAITKSDVDNDYAVTDFSGGADASVQFWAYVRPAPRSGAAY